MTSPIQDSHFAIKMWSRCRPLAWTRFSSRLGSGAGRASPVYLGTVDEAHLYPAKTGNGFSPQVVKNISSWGYKSVTSERLAGAYRHEAAVVEAQTQGPKLWGAQSGAVHSPQPGNSQDVGSISKDTHASGRWYLHPGTRKGTGLVPIQ